MVSFHIWTLVWILVHLFVFAPIADGNNNKNQVSRRHRHHRHRHHRHPKLQLPEATVKNSSPELDARKRKMTKILSSTPSFLIETSTSLILSNSSSYSDKKITSLVNYFTVRKAANINSENSTYAPNHIDTLKSFNDTSGSVTNTNSASSNLKKIVENSQTITSGIIDGLDDQDIAVPKETSAIVGSSSRLPSSSSKEENQFAKDLRKLFGSTENRVNSSKIPIETPIVRLIRRKRSISSEEVEDTNEKSRKPTLLDLNGPAILNDPEETVDRESSESLHKRVKRDGSEFDEAPSAISSQDSSYLQDLEDSFALSALEIEAQESQDSRNFQRKSRQSESSFDSSSSLARRPKREAEDNKNQSYKTTDFLPESKISASAYSVFENGNSVSIKRIDGIEHLRDASSLDLFTGVTDRNDEIIDVITPVKSFVESVEAVSKNILDLEHPKNTLFILDSSTSLSPSSSRAEPSQSAEDNKKYINYVSSSKSSDLDNFIDKEDEPITGYRVEDAENEINASFDSVKSKKATKRDYEEKDHQPEVLSVSVDSSLKDDNSIVTKREAEEKDHRPEVVSTSVDSSLKDDNSILRYRLDDVYPEILEDPANPSPMVQLVRTKRFGDGIVNPEAPDSSYANEVDNSRADEPYAEDDRIIDSMLSKVDYRSADEQNRSARNENGAPLEAEEIYSLKREENPIRRKRGVFAKRTRNKAGRGDMKKRKKKHKGRAKKRHRSKLKRSKMKRDSEDPSDRINCESEKMMELKDENFGDRKFESMDQEVISPHNGRHRRDSEDEDDENFYHDSNEAADGDRRIIRNSEDAAKVSEDEYKKKISRCPEAKTREKRDNTLQELKYYQNIRETDAGQNNQSGAIADKHFLSVKAARPIQDIEQLVEELLSKVNELHGYIKEGNENGATKSEASVASSSIVDRTTGEGSKIVQRVTGQDDSSPRPAEANVARRSEACWKYPATWTRQSESSKSNGKSARNSRAQRCSKKVRRKRTSHRKWDRWTDWSSCSVTCGRGRQIRWRHCIRNCSTAETEMEEKACQLPACAPGKFLGIFG